MFENRIFNRRKLIGLGLALFSIKLPLAVSASLANAKSEVGSEQSIGEVSIEFPDGYTMENYELDVPIWSKNDKVREFIRSFVSNGQLVEYVKSARDRGVNYRFVFNNPAALKSFAIGVRERKLIDFESRSSRGLVTRIHVSGAEITC